ncbi:MAG: phosphatidate cytidylyltransferase [Clostridia bacterium]|nr:phosphatidate cytidylyltransferase [Clostridia bacterium]
MKKRIMSGLLGGALVIILLTLGNTIIFNVMISFISVIALYEIFVTTHFVRNKPLLIIGFLFAAVVPFFPVIGFSNYGVAISCLFILAAFFVMLHQHSTITISEISFMFMMSILIPFALTSVLYINSLPTFFPEKYAQVDSFFLCLSTLEIAWFADIGAYFVGSFFGKRKLAPSISPKKTVEGAIGGVIIDVMLVLLFGLFWDLVILKDAGHIQYGYLALVAFLGSIIGIIGDLSFSFIKRECHIKDFGSIIPGHGGILDRFDSVLLVSPFVLLALHYVPIIVR